MVGHFRGRPASLARSIAHDVRAGARAKSLATLDELHITTEQLALKGIHPDLGTVTLSQVLAAWVVHDLNHIGQIVEVLSQQYAEAVGPWSAFLAILTRPILTD